ncbi:MAG: type IV secretion system DNA-binding domain-containing protein [Gammaproteobacteria bacterium]|nr:type IV secretion system DNA-binding domain-containing protein [Gammaproteobacteria bacterium]
MAKALHPLALRVSRKPAIQASMPVAILASVVAYVILFWLNTATQWDPFHSQPEPMTIVNLIAMLGSAWSAASPGWLIEHIAARADHNVFFAMWKYFGLLYAAPKTFTTVLWMRVADADVQFQLLVRFISVVGTALAAAMPVYRHVLSKTPKTRKANLVEGPRTLWYKKATIAARNYLAGLTANFGEGVELAPGLRLPRSAEYESFLVVGLPGSGKTVIAEGGLRQAIERGERAACLDVKGGLLSRILRFMGGTGAMAIGVGRNAAVWAIGKDVRLRSHASALAAILIPDSKDPVWSAAARLVLAAVMMRLNEKYGQRWGWRDLKSFISRPVEEISKDIQSVRPEIAQMLRGKGDDPTTAILSVMFSMLTHISEIVDTFSAMETENRPSLSLTQWVQQKTKCRVLVFQHDLSNRDNSRSVLTAMIRVTARELLGPGIAENFDHGIWLYLDEFPKLGKRIEELADLAALGRDRGIRVLATAQSLAQLKQEYGETGAEALTENFGMVIVCKARPGRNAKDLSETVLDIATYETDKAGTKGEKDLHKLPALTPHQISTELGLKFDWRSRKLIRAAVTGLDNVYVLEWQLDRWKRF